MASIKLELDSAEMMARKRLARRMVDFETIYVLHRDDRKGYLLLLALEEDRWRILESISLDHSKDRMEELHEMPIDKEGIEVIRIALKHWLSESRRDVRQNTIPTARDRKFSSIMFTAAKPSVPSRRICRWDRRRCRSC